MLAAGQNPNADDGQVVSDRYQIVHDYLLEKGLASWSINEDIPDTVAIPVINVVAYACSSEFGIVGQTLGQLAIEGALDASPVSLGERQLRKQQAPRYSGESARPDYF